MNITDIEIVSGQPAFEFEPLRKLEVKCEATNALMPAPTIDEANGRLRALASKVGANAIIDVDYKSGVSLTSWKSLRATGLAVRKISDERICPYCAETIKKAALLCRHCGSDIPAVVPSEIKEEIGIAEQTTRFSAQVETEPLRDNNNPIVIVSLVALGLFVLFLIIGVAG